MTKEEIAALSIPVRSIVVRLMIPLLVLLAALCAGHDLKEMRATPSLDYYQALFGLCGEVMLAIQRLPVPVLARVQGVLAGEKLSTW